MPPFTDNPVMLHGAAQVAFVITAFPVMVGLDPITTVTGFLKEPGQMPM